MKLKPPFMIVIMLLFFSVDIFAQKKFKSIQKTDGFSITPKLGLGSLVGELGDVWTMNPNLGFCL